MITKRLLLLGGGHTHALLIKRLGMMPIPGVEVLLVSPQSLTPYSGMLPGHLAGTYSHDEMHIDLVRVCAANGVQFIQAAAQRIDKQQKKIFFADRPPIVFDVLSINIGSIPEKEPWGIGIKPMHDFLGQWSQVETARSIAIIGGGAGGVEVALSLNSRFQDRKKISIIHRGANLLPQAPKGLQKKIMQLCRARGITLHLKDPNPAAIAQAHDLVLWTSSARAPEILRESTLAVDERGFLMTNELLLCLGEDKIFAVGDCAHIRGQYRPRSGVYAVRLAKPLEHNIRRLFRGLPLRPAILQKKHLALITTGGKEAFALRGRLYWQAKWIWPFKDKIDRAFMAKFDARPPRTMTMQAPDPMRCLGCGAKLGGVALKSVLTLLAKDYPAVLTDAAASQSLAMNEDVALVQMQGWVMQSMDYFPAFMDDPFLVGKIACLHAAGDLLVKGGTPQSCLALAVMPHKAPDLLKDDFYQLLAGVASVLQTMGTRLIGGHSAEGKQLAVGLQLQGPQPTANRWKPKSGLRAGDSLVLTKPIGTGIVFAGVMQSLTRGYDRDTCLSSMLLNHFALLEMIADEAVHGATDVTGFGLLGHLAEMVAASQMGVELSLKDLPLLPGVQDLLARGVQSTLALENEQYASSLCEMINLQESTLLCDPQTSGPFLLSMDAEKAQQWVTRARALGFTDCSIVGQVKGDSPVIRIVS